MDRARIQKISVVHEAGRTYTGFVDVINNGAAARLQIEMTYRRGEIHWKLTPIGEQK